MCDLPSSWMMTWILLLSLWLGLVQGMRTDQIRELRCVSVDILRPYFFFSSHGCVPNTDRAVSRKETQHLFYHGYDNYMKYAFPEDELRPLSCTPLTRDRDSPGNAALNDVLGNYSLTLIDSLSSLAILASDPEDGAHAWTHFQNGIQDFVRLYGDGSDGPGGQGEKARGFDLDSKVQVFETVIRGLGVLAPKCVEVTPVYISNMGILTGGLLSAHLFAVGDLPISGYHPPEMEAAFAKAWDKTEFPGSQRGIQWENGFVYDGQFLRLAMDLANRIIPAFYTDTGLPYPRVNLRYGVQRHPFYANSPLNADRTCGGAEPCPKSRRFGASAETTESCSAGAGSLVLEFAVLSRLTGDGRYEEMAKRAFWAVWKRRSEIGLIGNAIDVESGRWIHSYTGVGQFHNRAVAFGANRLVRGCCRSVQASIASLSMRSSLTSCCPRESVPRTTPIAIGIS